LCFGCVIKYLWLYVNGYFKLFPVLDCPSKVFVDACGNP